MAADDRIRWVFTDRTHGDLAVADPSGEVQARRTAIADGPWTWLHQEHGATVHAVTVPGEHAGAVGDGAVTRVPGAPLAVHTADCAPVLLIGDGAVGVAHAGWRGLAAGVVEATAAAMAALGAAPTAAQLGPCIRSRCYEFGADDLAVLADRYGPGVVAETAQGAPALDVAAAVSQACARLDLSFRDVGTCTACSPVHWSHRAGADAERQALVAWIEP